MHRYILFITDCTTLHVVDPSKSSTQNRVLIQKKKIK